jgi:hypothetical protein
MTADRLEPGRAPGTAGEFDHSGNVMRLIPLTFAAAAALALGACSSTDGGRSGLAETFSLDNYKASSNTNGTQTRPDVNRAYTQPTMPTIANRGM